VPEPIYPFITFLTPTYKRPHALMACMASVEAQTAREEIQHLVWPDYVGRGIGGMYAEIHRQLGPAILGEYVHLLADDDILAGPDVVRQVQQVAAALGFPPMIIVRANKGGMFLPLHQGEPKEGHIDLGCFITRRDVWLAHRYGQRYEGDYDFAKSVWDSVSGFHYTNLHFLTGGVSRGRAGHECTEESHRASYLAGSLTMERRYSCPTCLAEVAVRK
jgi:hypothetical protein